MIINELIKLIEDISIKQVSKNKIPIKAANADKKILNFNEEQKHNGIKILTPKQMVQKVALTQVKAGNTFENLLNEIRQIICSLYQ